MNRFLLRILMSFLFLCSYGIVAQTSQNVQFKAVKYKPNVKAPLTNKEKKMIVDVYGLEAANKYIFGIPQLLKDTKHLLRNRVKIFELTNKDISDLKNLSDIPLFNHFQNIERDHLINENNFNPLKYDLNFYSKETQYIRIDNTQKVIIITSQFE